MNKMEKEAATRMSILQDLTEDVRDLVVDLNKLKDKFKDDIDLELITAISETVETHNTQIKLYVIMSIINLVVSSGAMAVAIVALTH